MRSPVRHGRNLMLACLLGIIPVSAYAGAVDAYGCYGQKATRMCTSGLLTGQTFTSLTAELKAYIAAQQTIIAGLNTQITDLTVQLNACRVKCPPSPPPPPPPSTDFPKTLTDGQGLWLLTAPHGTLTLNGTVVPTSGALDLRLCNGSVDVQGIDLLWYHYIKATSTWSYGAQTCGPVSQRGSLTLDWQPNSEPDLAGYHVYCGTASRVYSLIAPATQLTFTWNNLASGTVYCAVTAYDHSQNESAFSAEVSKVIP